eukprot:9049570-Pyramimonas_sp.AAC.1
MVQGFLSGAGLNGLAALVMGARQLEALERSGRGCPGDGEIRAAQQRRGSAGRGGADNGRNIQRTLAVRGQQLLARRSWAAPAKSGD